MTRIKAAVAGMFIGLSAVTLGVSACSPIIERHGYIPPQSDLGQITPGQSTREAALALLPPPTMEGPIAGGSFYYVYNEFRTLGASARKEVDRQVLAIDVNAAGIVTGVTRYGLRDGKIVPLVQNVTDDNIANVTFIQQLMGGVGNIDGSQFFGG